MTNQNWNALANENEKQRTNVSWQLNNTNNEKDVVWFSPGFVSVVGCFFVGISHSPDIDGNMIWLGNDYVANAANEREKVMRNKTEGP